MTTEENSDAITHPFGMTILLFCITNFGQISCKGDTLKWYDLMPLDIVDKFYLLNCNSFDSRLQPIFLHHSLSIISTPNFSFQFYLLLRLCLSGTTTISPSITSSTLEHIKANTEIRSKVVKNYLKTID